MIRLGTRTRISWMQDKFESRNRMIKVETRARVGWVKDDHESRNRMIRVKRIISVLMNAG